MVTLTVLNKYLDLDIFLNLLSIFFTSQNYIIITLINTQCIKQTFVSEGLSAKNGNINSLNVYL